MDKSFSAVGRAAMAAVFGLGLALAPAAQAAEGFDTGVGRVIAAQGNNAIELIKAEVRESIQGWRPSMKTVRKPRPGPVQVRTPTAAGGQVPVSVQCAP